MSDDDRNYITSYITNYVTNTVWRQPAGRADAIDEVADQFERPAAPVSSGAAEFWSPAPDARWPRASQGWRSVGRLHARAPERQAG